MKVRAAKNVSNTLKWIGQFIEQTAHTDFTNHSKVISIKKVIKPAKSVK